jgi:hypothetical protein
LALLLAAVVHATPSGPALYLGWEAPSGCPDRAWVLSEVRRLRGELTVLEHSREALLAARATVTPFEGDWRVEIDTFTRGVSGHRSLSADTCERAVASAAVVLSLALTNAAAQPPPAPAAPGAPVPEVTASLPVEPPVTPTTLGMALVGGGRAGPLPSFAPGVALSFALILSAARLELGVLSPLPSQRVSTGPRACDIWVPLIAELGVAVPLIRDKVQLDFVADVSAAWMTGHGVGPSVPLTNSGGWLAFEGGGALHLPLWRSLGLRIEGRVGAAAVRPVFTVDGTPVYDAPVVTGRVGAGVEWLF